MPVLDTNFLIALHAQEPAAIAAIEGWRGEPLIVPSIVAVEFLTAFGPDASEAMAELQKGFEIVHTSPEWILTAAELRHRLRQKRKIVRWGDFWVASWAKHHDTFVVTRNGRDFDSFGVPTRSW